MASKTEKKWGGWLSDDDRLRAAADAIRDALERYGVELHSDVLDVDEEISLRCTTDTDRQLH